MPLVSGVTNGIVEVMSDYPAMACSATGERRQYVQIGLVGHGDRAIAHRDSVE